jgi:UDP-2-acetamido-3-amino-2,3-dideoxy-glucuronate N-acetyltransferase
MLRFGLIGCGRFGKHYLSNIAQGGFGSVDVICTRRPLSGVSVSNGPPWCGDYRQVCRDPSIDCVIVATPPSSHFMICREALSSGKHVICEKPFVFEVAEAEELNRMADERGCILIVNYIHLWNMELTRLFKAFDFSQEGPHFVDFQATCCGPFRTEYSMLWDWYSHDLALLLHHVGAPSEDPVSNTFLFNSAENSGVFTANCRIGGVKAHSFVSNLCGVKRKTVSITGPRGTLCYEDDFNGKPLMAMLRDFSMHWTEGKRFTNGPLAVEVTRFLTRCHLLRTRETTSQR